MSYQNPNIHRPSFLKNQSVSTKSCPRETSHRSRFFVPFGVFALIITMSFLFADSVSHGIIPAETDKILEQIEPYRPLDRAKVAQLIDSHIGSIEERAHFTVVDRLGRKLTVNTFLDEELQAALRDILDHSYAAGGAIVVIDPNDGRILGFAEKPLKDEDSVLFQTLPAASIFKIITAATALESAHMNPESKISYNGQKHTLYRSNLSTKITKYTHFVTLSDAFAESINPVFGKIGVYHVGGDTLNEYGEKFRFNRPLPSDVPVPQSELSSPETDFEIAEVASGFNKTTKLNPLHAAWISHIILNRGAARSVGMVESVQDETGALLYSYQPTETEQIISARTSDELLDMMRGTVLKGTARKSFRKFRVKISNGEIDVGGKTGNINNEENTIKYDWFVGFCDHPVENKSVVFAVVMLHTKKLGFRAHRVASQVLERYFQL